MDEKLITQLRLLKKYTDILSRIKEVSKNKYLNDEIIRGSAERYIQLAIESCINIGNRILSQEQINNNINPPEAYADIFENLYKLRIIDENFAESLKHMAKFRNKLVHMYWEIDNDFVYSILQNRLTDFEKFISVIANYVNRYM